MAVKKATKKFEKNKLKGELERRNAHKKIKQRHQLTEKRKARRAGDNGDAKPVEKKSALKDMTMDEFFQGGFELPEAKVKKGAKKRKREVATGSDAGDSASVRSLEDTPVAPDSDESSDVADDTMMDGHKGDLEALAQKDPEFYKYLQENDAELLDFGGSDEGADNDDGPPKKKAKSKAKPKKEEEDDDADIVEEDSSGTTEISKAMVEKWSKNMQKLHSLSALREIVLGFRAAVHANDDDEGQTFKYSVSSPEVYHALLVTALQHIPGVLNHHLPVKETAAGKARIATDSKKFSTLSPLLNTHTGSILHLLGSLSDAATLKLTMAALVPLVPYILTLKKAVRQLTKAAVAVWSELSNSESTRINAFLLLRRLAVAGDASIREAALRAAYQGLVRSSRATTVHSLPAVNLMKNSAVELWGLDGGLAYTTGFASIRQLAVHLRSTTTQPTKDSYKAVYNWQYVHSLDFWSRVLSAHCSPAANAALKSAADSPLHPLIYPLVQITLGALRLIPTPAYFPLRFFLVAALLRLSRATRTYIPLAPPLLEVLQSPELRAPPKPGKPLRPLDLDAVLRAPKAYLRSRAYQDAAGDRAVALLAEFFGVWAQSIAFPELAVPPPVWLKRWLRDTTATTAITKPGARGGAAAAAAQHKRGRGGNRNPKLNAAVALLVQKMAANAEFVEARRRGVEFAVADRKAVRGFLADLPWEDMPLGAYVLGLRRQREERDRVLAESRRADERERQKGEDEDGAEVDDGSEDDNLDEAVEGDETDDGDDE